MRLQHAAMLATILTSLLSGTAKASYIINIDQQNSDVVAIGYGSLNLYIDPPPNLDLIRYVQVWAAQDEIRIGGDGRLNSVAALVQGPDNFGPGGRFFATSGSGSPVELDRFNGDVYVPDGYVSGDPLSSLATWDNTTISGLGLTPGTYAYTVQTRNSITDATLTDTFTINIGGPSPVPLPASAPMLGAALLALAGFGYGMKRRAAPKINIAAVAG